MADDTALPDLVAQVQSALKVFRTGLVDLSTVVSGVVHRDVSKATSEGLKEGVDDAGQHFDDFARAMEEGLSESASDGLGSGLQQAFEIGGQMLSRFRESLHNGLSQLKATVGLVAGEFDPHSLENLGRSVGQFMEDRPVSLGLVLSEDSIRRVIGTSRVNEIEKKMTEFTKNVGPALAQISGNAIELGENIDAAMSQASDSMFVLGTSSQENTQYIQAMAAAGLELTKQFDSEFTIKLNVGDALPNLNAVSTAQLLARGSGLEMNQTVGILRDSMRQLGYSASEAVNIFGTFKQVQQDSGLPISDVEGRLMESAKAMRFFGGNVETVASTYKTFLNVLGEKRAAVALEVASDVAGGLANMNFGNRAFLGMTGSIGGEGGAVGAGLRVEQALETGEGLEGIIEDLKNTLRRSTGTEVLSRDTALATGQEQQFLAQRQITGQFLGIQDPGKLNQILETFASNQQVKTSDLRAGQEGATQQVAETGRQLINQTMGPIEQSLNRLSGLNFQSIQQAHEDFVALNASAQTFAQNFLEPLKDVLGGQRTVGGKKGDNFFTNAPPAPDTLERLQNPAQFGAPALLSGETAAQQPTPLGTMGFGLRPLAVDQSLFNLPQPTPLAPSPPTDAAIKVAQDKIEERQLKLKVMLTNDEIQVVPVQLKLQGAQLSLEPFATELLTKMKQHVQLASDDLATPN